MTSPWTRSSGSRTSPTPTRRIPQTQQSFDEVFPGIPDDVVEMVSHGNAERLFRWKMADEALLLSPDVSSWRATLDDDPYAAMQLRHDLAAVEHRDRLRRTRPCDLRGDGPSGRAHRAVRRARVDADGTCSSGHRAGCVGSAPSRLRDYQGVLMQLQYALYDADNHYYEPPDCYTRHIEPKFRDRAIHVEQDDEG